jgi:hypothetical protein
LNPFFSVKLQYTFPPQVTFYISPSVMSLLLLSLIFITQLLSTPLYCSAFSANNLVLLRIGATGSGTALSSNYASVYLDEINPTSATTAVTSSLVSGVTLSGTDYTQGSLSRSMDKSRLYFGGTTATAGSAISLSRPYGSFTRAIVSIDSSGTSYIRTVPSASYDGVISAVCGKDSSGAWFLGNSSTIAVGYVNFDTSTWITQMSISTSGSPFTGCGISQNGNLYLLKTISQTPYGNKVVNAPTTGTMYVDLQQQLDYSPYTTKQIITNSDESRLWACIVTLIASGDSGIYTGTLLSNMNQMLSSPDSYRVTGIALSPGETILYFTTTNKLFSVSSSCLSSCVPTTLRTAASNTEYRGLAPVPISTGCSAYNNDCVSCASDPSCYFCGQSSSSGTCSSSTSCSSSFYAQTASSCSAGGVTPSPSPRSISSYTLSFYLDSTCSLTRTASVTMLDGSCSIGSTTTGNLRSAKGDISTDGTYVYIYYYLNGACTAPYYMGFGGIIGTCYTYSDPTTGFTNYFKIVLNGNLQPSATPSASRTPSISETSSRSMTPTRTPVNTAITTVTTPTASSTPPAIVQYRSTFYTDSDCATTAGSILVTDKTCSSGIIDSYSRGIYATLNGASNTVSWTIYTSSFSSCTGSIVASSTSTPVGVCSSFYDATTFTLSTLSYLLVHLFLHLHQVLLNLSHHLILELLL